MSNDISSTWQNAIKQGIIAGVVAVLLSLVGLVSTFSQKYLISGVLTMGQVWLFAPILLFAFTVARHEGESTKRATIFGILTGGVGGLVIALFLILGHYVNLRYMFANASPQLYQSIAFGVSFPLSIFIPILAGLVIGAIASGILMIPPKWRTPLIQALLGILLFGILRDPIVNMMANWGVVGNLFGWLFAFNGLTPFGAVVVFLVAGGLSYWRSTRKTRVVVRSTARQKTTRAATIFVIAIVVLLLPQILGIYFSEILDNVGLYILMGLGLNIVVGYAGLLDLGYVAFYAIGAYTVGVLTSPELAATPLTYWQALPIALITATLAGVLLGLPVLRMRGDYLAIVTLGFGEIIRILALSDWLRPNLGGAQGIQAIAQPRIGSYVLGTQQQLYYIILIGIGIAAFISWRIKDSRLGRSWMAMREDEDVAQAMGINLVATKLMAFAMGALFSGLSGTIFAAKLTAAYPHSFNLLVSINVLSLIIVGGIGSIPGVFVGSLVLIGLPDLLREFAEFRYLVYGAVLVAMMLLRPEGLWPEERRKLELHEDDTIVPVEEDLSTASAGD